MRFKKSTPIFSFTPSYATDLKKTFAKAYKRIEDEKRKDAEQAKVMNVRQINRRSA